MGHYVSTPDYSLRFTVEEGKKLYLGNFHCHPNRAKNMLGAEIAAGFHFEILDFQGRDVQIVSSNYPKLEFPQVESVIPNWQGEQVAAENDP